jgi:methyltransferase (TIGR00027 family)
MAEHEIDDKKSAVPFTARLIAYYRAQESRQEAPLIVDPFAERLAGDMTQYFNEHKGVRGTNDYIVVRTHYIDNHVLAPWCDAYKQSQIVLLGAGLDARAYRFQPLKKNKHTVFEIDFDIVNNYKAAILKNQDPLCNLERVSADLSKPDWTKKLEKAGFSSDISTLWLLEGLIYYIDQDMVVSVLKTAAENSAEASQIFADVCIPGLTLAQYGPFMMHFKWGLNKEDVPPFFAHSGWNVTCGYADDFDQGRDVSYSQLMPSQLIFPKLSYSHSQRSSY